MKTNLIPLATALLLLCSQSALAGSARLELGAFETVNNRFNIPNPGGSRIWVDSDKAKFYGRAELQFDVSERGTIRLLFAPLQTDYTYTSPSTLAFNGKNYPASTPLAVTYRFNSYRLGYIYKFLATDQWSMSAGLIAKVRDAKIEVNGGGVSSTYSNVGFVPLFNFGVKWKSRSPWGVRFDIDGAAAKQGRAFDGSLEGFYSLNESGDGPSAGIRMLEGGADNTKVFTFALLRYAFLAYTKSF